MPSETSLHSDCGDSIHTVEAVPLRNRKIYDSLNNSGTNCDKTLARSRPVSAYSELSAVPRIVITPTPEDNEKRRASWACYDDDSNKKSSNPFDTFEMLSSKLSQLYSNGSFDCDNKANDEPKPQSPVLNPSPRVSPHFSNEKFLTHSQELDSSQSESESESDNNSESESDSSAEKPYQETSEPHQRKRHDSLYEIEDIRDSEIHSDDESADIIEFIIDQGDHMSNCDTVEFNDHLSVIFEEDEHSHSRRIKMDSMCSSNSSATLANDDNDSKHFHSDDAGDSDSSTVESDNDNSPDSDDEDDQSTSVTVRLPLRLSFSRSSNDEEITTVMVGKSEIQVEENVSPNKTPVKEDPAPDVSVSFCLRPRSCSTISDQKSSENKSFDSDSNRKSFDNDDDSEVSVSISLPLRHRTVSPTPLTIRPTFTRQQTLSPVPHNHGEFEYKVWNRGFSIERDSSVSKSIQPQTQPQTQPQPTIQSFRNDNYEENNDNNNEEPEHMSFRDRIAAFETIAASKKEELHRQNACTSFDEPIQEEDIKYHQEVHSNPPQTDDFAMYYNNNSDNNSYIQINSHFDQHNYEPSYEQQTSYEPCFEAQPSYESYVTSQYTVNLEPEPAPEFIDPEQQPQFTIAEQVDEEHPEDDFKANLSVQQKIAAFEQPSPNEPLKIDAREEISMARETRESNQQESIAKRFLSKVAESQSQPQNTGFDVKLTSESQQSNGNGTINKPTYIQHSNFVQRGLEETDSGVDIHRRGSDEIDTESECYSELRKLTRYERAATHSRLFKILQEYETDVSDVEKSKIDDDIMPFSRPKKIVHNVSITRKQNPELVKQAETMAERRERLHLSYNSSSIDADNPSSSASPSCTSPTPSVNEKLIDELVHSVLQQTKRRNLRNIPIEKIQAAARRALIQQNEENNDSCDTFSSFDSTPALTPHEFQDDYYDSDPDRHMDILPSKAFKNLQEQSTYGRRNKSWAARCPRVLSSKTVNSDLSRVTETRESQSPERDQYAYNY